MWAIQTVILTFLILRCLAYNYKPGPTVLLSSDMNWTDLLTTTPKPAGKEDANGFWLGAPRFEPDRPRNLTACRSHPIKVSPRMPYPITSRNVTWVVPKDAIPQIELSNDTFDLGLTIRNVSDDSVGWYYCIIRNSQGVAKDEIYVDVTNCPKLIELEHRSGKELSSGSLNTSSYLSSKSYPLMRSAKLNNLHVLMVKQQPLGSNATLTCRIDGPVKRLYFFDGIKNITSSTSSNVTSISITLHNIGPRECGYYMCIAEMYGCFLSQRHNVCLIEASEEVTLAEYDMDRWGDYIKLAHISSGRRSYQSKLVETSQSEDVIDSLGNKKAAFNEDPRNIPIKRSIHAASPDNRSPGSRIRKRAAMVDPDKAYINEGMSRFRRTLSYVASTHKYLVVINVMLSISSVVLCAVLLWINFTRANQRRPSYEFLSDEEVKKEGKDEGAEEGEFRKVVETGEEVVLASGFAAMLRRKQDGADEAAEQKEEVKSEKASHGGDESPPIEVTFAPAVTEKGKEEKELSEKSDSSDGMENIGAGLAAQIIIGESKKPDEMDAKEVPPEDEGETAKAEVSEKLLNDFNIPPPPSQEDNASEKAKKGDEQDEASTATLISNEGMLNQPESATGEDAKPAEDKQVSEDHDDTTPQADVNADEEEEVVDFQNVDVTTSQDSSKKEPIRDHCVLESETIYDAAVMINKRRDPTKP